MPRAARKKNNNNNNNSKPQNNKQRVREVEVSPPREENEQVPNSPSTPRDSSFYETLAKGEISQKLFVIKGKPMVFYVAPCVSKQQITNLITKGGGLVQRLANSKVITLVDTRSEIPPKIAFDCYSIRYVSDSILQQKRADLKKYKVTQTPNKRDSFSPRKRTLFTEDEDAQLIEFVNNHGQYTPSSNRLWKLAEEEEILGNHTWQSMRSRYLKVARKLNFDDDDGEKDDHRRAEEDEEEEDKSHDNVDVEENEQSEEDDVNDEDDDDNRDNQSSDDLEEKSGLEREESFIDASYLDKMDTDDILTQDFEDRLTNSVSKTRANTARQSWRSAKNNDNDDNDVDVDVRENKNKNRKVIQKVKRLSDFSSKDGVKEIVLSVINNLMLTTNLPRSVVVHGLIVNNGVVSDTIQYLKNPQEFYFSRSKSSQIWTYTEDKMILEKHKRGLEDLANTRGTHSLQQRQLYLES